MDQDSNALPYIVSEPMRVSPALSHRYLCEMRQISYGMLETLTDNTSRGSSIKKTMLSRSSNGNADTPLTICFMRLAVQVAIVDILAKARTMAAFDGKKYR